MSNTAMASSRSGGWTACAKPPARCHQQGKKCLCCSPAVPYIFRGSKDFSGTDLPCQRAELQINTSNELCSFHGELASFPPRRELHKPSLPHVASPAEVFYCPGLPGDQGDPRPHCFRKSLLQMCCKSTTTQRGHHIHVTNSLCLQKSHRKIV